MGCSLAGCAQYFARADVGSKLVSERFARSKLSWPTRIVKESPMDEAQIIAVVGNDRLLLCRFLDELPPQQWSKQSL